MRTRIIALFGLAAASSYVIWLSFQPPRPAVGGFDRSKNLLPADARKVLDRAERFVLYSLEPFDTLKVSSWALLTNAATHLDPPPDAIPKEKFHDYGILGATEIRDRDERAELLRALYRGITDSDGMAFACFNPRHGIRATHAGQTVDLVICFECLMIQAHAKREKYVLTTRFPLPTFNRALQKAGVPIARND